MFQYYRTRGIILKKTDRGEADRIFVVYTQDFGKLEILGKAIRKIKSKLRGGMELFYLSEIEFIQGKTYKTLTNAILIENFPNIKKDLERLTITYKISEVLDNLIKGQEPDEKIWHLLTETFQKLNTLHLTSFTLHLIYYYFLWNLLSILGYQPGLYNCALCQKKLTPEKLYFNFKEGGIICQDCFKKVKSGKETTTHPPHPRSLPKVGGRWEGRSPTHFVSGPLNPETVKILRIILEKNWKTLSKLKIEKPYLKSLNIISKECYLYIRNS
jgi:DNA repair protein RecO (recombination protein O)